MTKGHWLLACLLALAAVSSGCIGVYTSYEGNPISRSAVESLKVGETTRAEVVERLGAPTRLESADLTNLAEQALARYEGEELMLRIDPALFNDVYVYERTRLDRFAILLGLFNYGTSDTRSDRLVVFFDAQGVVEGIGWSPAADGADGEEDEE